MIESWVIDRLDPLKSEKLIVLADPQRMIRAGARAVDGWAKENGFTYCFAVGISPFGKCTRTCGTTRGQAHPGDSTRKGQALQRQLFLGGRVTYTP